MPSSLAGRQPALPAPVAAGLALGAVALGIGALLLLRGGAPAQLAAPDPDTVAPLVATRPPTDAAPAPVPVVAPSALPVPPAVAAPARPALTVINNSRIPDLGQRLAARYRAAGWPVAAVGQVHGRIRATTVYYDPGGREQARAAAAALGVPRVLPRLPDLPGRGLTVVVTRDAA